MAADLPGERHIRGSQNGARDDQRLCQADRHIGATPAVACDVVQHEMPADRQVAAIAASQHGTVTRAQLLACGLGRGAIEYRVSQGRLHVLHPGVYAVGHTAQPPLAREAAALLACGEGTLLSHRAAAVIWRVPGIVVAPEVDVTLVGRQCRPKPGVHIHRVKEMPAFHTRRYANLLVTSPARTLLDIAPQIADRELERTYDDALVRRLITHGGIREVVSSTPRRPGSRRLLALATGSRVTTVTRSDTEERFLALIRRGRLPAPEVNARVGRYSVDFLWREARLIVEVDGYAFHSSRGAFERDHDRDLVLGSAHFTVLRFTWRQIDREPEFVLVRLAQELVRAGVG